MKSEAIDKTIAMYNDLRQKITKAMGFKEEYIYETGPECKTKHHDR